VLMYSGPTMSLLAKQISELVFVGIQSYINYLVIRNWNLSKDVRMNKSLMFHSSFLSVNMCSVLYNVFNFALVHNCSGDDMLRTVFMPQSICRFSVRLFDDYVGYRVYVYLDFCILVLFFVCVLLLLLCK